jgi:hypothetical protein
LLRTPVAAQAGPRGRRKSETYSAKLYLMEKQQYGQMMRFAREKRTKRIILLKLVAICAQMW